jgi:ribonuclease P protein component
VGKDNAELGVGARLSSGTSRSRAYPKSVRLRKRREFLAVQGTGRKFHAQHFLVVVTPIATSSTSRAVPGDGSVPGRECPMGRVGITVTKKIGNAVTRNRTKRLVREHVRQSRWLDRPVNTVFIAKRSAADLTSLAEVAADLSSIANAIDAARRRDASFAGSRRRPR